MTACAATLPHSPQILVLGPPLPGFYLCLSAAAAISHTLLPFAPPKASEPMGFCSAHAATGTNRCMFQTSQMCRTTYPQGSLASLEIAPAPVQIQPFSRLWLAIRSAAQSLIAGAEYWQQIHPNSLMPHLDKHSPFCCRVLWP